jgi:hypothetical protein
MPSPIIVKAIYNKKYYELSLTAFAELTGTARSHFTRMYHDAKREGLTDQQFIDGLQRRRIQGKRKKKGIKPVSDIKPLMDRWLYRAAI